MIMAAPLTEGVQRIIVCPHGTPARERDRPIEFAEVAAAWQRITGEDISAGSASWVSSFTDATRQASEYRRDRVLLVGDAAHIHLPAGGQGLSTGVQDAANLGWKLAATVTGRAPEGLLDTYHGERHPVGERLLMNTRAQGIVFLGGEQSEPLRRLFGELIEQHDVVKRHLAGIVSGLDVRYDLGAGHPLLGMRLGGRQLVTAGGELGTTETLHPAHGVLLDLDDDADLRAAAEEWSGQVDIVTGALKPVDGEDPLDGVTGLLLRPDGHIAWITADGGTEGLVDSLTRWFGEPRRGSR
jgi:bifunctional hydroxylase/dehydrase